MCTCFLNGPAWPWNTKTLDCFPWPRYVRLNASSAVSLSFATASSISITSTFVIGKACWQVGHRCCSIVPPWSAPRDRGFEQEVIHLGVPLRFPHVATPDVRAVIGDEDGECSCETIIFQCGFDLIDELALARRVADHGNEVAVFVGQPADAFQHLELLEHDVVVIA